MGLANLARKRDANLMPNEQVTAGAKRAFYHRGKKIANLKLFHFELFFAN